MAPFVDRDEITTHHRLCRDKQICFTAITAGHSGRAVAGCKSLLDIAAGLIQLQYRFNTRSKPTVEATPSFAKRSCVLSPCHNCKFTRFCKLTNKQTVLEHLQECSEVIIPHDVDVSQQQRPAGCFLLRWARQGSAGHGILHRSPRTAISLRCTTP